MCIYDRVLVAVGGVDEGRVDGVVHLLGDELREAARLGDVLGRDLRAHALREGDLDDADGDEVGDVADAVDGRERANSSSVIASTQATAAA